MTPISKCVNALSGLYLISTKELLNEAGFETKVSMPSRAYTSFLQELLKPIINDNEIVSMPSRAYTSFLRL